MQPGDAVYLSLTVYGGPNDGRYSERIVGAVNSRDAGWTPHGTFDLVLSPERPSEDGVAWIKLEPDAVAAITRDYLEDPATGLRARWHIGADDPPDTYREDDADLARRIRAMATWVREQASIVPLPPATPNAIDPPYPVPTTTFGWAAGDAAYAMGAFALDDDQALVIRGRSPDCVFWNMCLWNPLLHTYNYDYERVTINGAQVRVRARRLLDDRGQRAAPDAPELGVHRRASQRPHLVPLVPPGPHPRASRGRGRAGGRPYEHPPGPGPDRRPGRAALHRRGPRHPRLHGRGGLPARPRTRGPDGGGRRARPGWTTSAPPTSASGSTCCAGPCGRRAASTEPA